jgi:hypothetical protein
MNCRAARARAMDRIHRILEGELTGLKAKAVWTGFTG